jgi:hypothetical protein
MGLNSLGETSLWNQEAGELFAKTLVGCFVGQLSSCYIIPTTQGPAETISFHAGVTCCCALVLRILGTLPRNPKALPSAIRREFRCGDSVGSIDGSADCPKAVTCPSNAAILVFDEALFAPDVVHLAT